MSETPDSEIPLGKKIRDRVNAALADPRKESIQLELLDKSFENLSILIPKLFKKEYDQLESQVKSHSTQDPDKAPIIIITAVSTAAKTEDLDSPYSPIRRFQIPVTTTFMQFNAQQIRGLPGYKKMHEAVRELDMAVSINGLVDEGEGRGGQALVTVNAMKSYDMGADSMYPDLPARKPKFDKGKSKGFDL